MPFPSRFFFDAHLDQFGPQSGGWGSPEQLEGMERLGGALRVFFCEREASAPNTPDIHLAEAVNIRDNLMPPHMPARWEREVHFRYHVEGMESGRDLPEYEELIDTFASWGVNGSNPIYHRNNPLGGCSKESGVGLTTLGRQVLANMRWRSWWLDLAHMSQRSAQQVLELWDQQGCVQRLCYTHGGIRHTEIADPVLTNGNLERSLDLDQARELVRSGGLVCLSPAKPFYNRLEGPFLEHIKLLGEASNWDGLGIGTDYGGILDEWRLPGCRTVADCFQTVTDFLLSNGLTEVQVSNVVGLNAQRFFMR